MDEPIEHLEQLLSRPLPDCIALLRRRSLPLSTLFPSVGADTKEASLTCPVCGKADLWPYASDQHGEIEIMSFLGHCHHVVALVFVTTYTEEITQTTPYLVRVSDFQEEDEQRP